MLHGEVVIVPLHGVVLLLKPSELNCLTGLLDQWDPVDSPTFTSADLFSLELDRIILIDLHPIYERPRLISLLSALLPRVPGRTKL